MMAGRIGDGGRPQASHFGVQQGFEKSEFSRSPEDLPANPGPVRQAVRAQRVPPPTGDELLDDVRTDQDGARQLIRVDDVEAEAGEHGQGRGLAATNATGEP